MTTRKISHISNKLAVYLQSVLLGLPVIFGTLPVVHAAQLENRSIRLSTAQLGAPAEHLMLFDIASSTSIGSISFLYCTNSPMLGDPCTPPAGLDLNNANLTAQTNNTGFSISVPDSSINNLVLTRAAVVSNPGASSYHFSNVINPTTPNQTTYVRIATFASTDGTGPAIDDGAVAFATVDIFQVDAYVPPYLTFCVGVFVTLNCNSVTGFSIDIGELQTNRTATGTMQFSGATNDESGYTTYINGFTMTSGNNVITALGSNGSSQLGTSQFGLNLRANSNPSVGLDPVGVGSSAPTVGYGSPDSFRFVNGEALTTTSLPTDFKVFTAAYIVNVPQSQPPGVYVTTMTYTAIASF